MSELVKALVAKKPEMKMKDVSDFVVDVFSEIASMLLAGKKVHLPAGKGVFSSKVVPPRLQRNPKTGEMVQGKEKIRVKFKAGVRFLSQEQPKEAAKDINEVVQLNQNVT